MPYLFLETLAKKLSPKFVSFPTIIDLLGNLTELLSDDVVAQLAPGFDEPKPQVWWFKPRGTDTVDSWRADLLIFFAFFFFRFLFHLYKIKTVQILPECIYLSQSKSTPIYLNPCMFVQIFLSIYLPIQYMSQSINTVCQSINTVD